MSDDETEKPQPEQETGDTFADEPGEEELAADDLATTAEGISQSGRSYPGAITPEALAQIQRVVAKPWLQAYAANNIIQDTLGRQTSSLIRNFSNGFASQSALKAIQSGFTANLPLNLDTGVTLSPETLRAIRGIAIPNQALLKALNPIADNINRMLGDLQGAARAALLAGFATKTQEFLTTDHRLRYRWNRPVWHYTNGHALLAILRNGQLWASSPENLNDASEMKHGFGVIKQAFADQMEESKKEEHHDPADWETVEAALSNVLEEHYFNSIVNEVYYISASAEPDNLTLWRNYADGDGFAVGIDTTAELSADGIAVDEEEDGEHIRNDVPLISGWYRVSYKTREKQKLAQEFIQNAIQDIDDTAERNRPVLVQELRKQAVILAAVMKHEAFQDEREVRWITTNFTTFNPVHYEHGRKSIVPVLHVMTSSSEDDLPLPLKGLRCSPIPNDSIVRTIQGLLKQRGYDQASRNVVKSQQPFKG